jgi:hypothetical protein
MDKGKRKKKMQRCNHPLIQFIVGIVTAVFISGESIAEENADWKDRFFAEAPKRWEGYLHFARSLQLSVTGTWYKGANRSPEKNIRSEFKQTDGACLHIFQGIGLKGEGEAAGINPSYSFKLKRRGPDRGWIITALEFPKPSASFSDEQRMHQEKQLQTICDCLKLWNLWLPTLIQDPDFKVTAIKNQEIDGSPVVRFEFSYPKPDKDYPVQGAIRLKGGWMVLDPEHDWILREYLVHTGQPEKYFIHKTFRIREGSRHHPIITHVTVHTVGKDEPSFERIIEGEWQTVEQSDVPLEEFTLSAFGLPEPPGIQVKRSRLYLWIALAGIVCLSIGALIRRQIRRTRTAG